MSTTGGAEYLKYSSTGQPGQEDTALHFRRLWLNLLPQSFASQIWNQSFLWSCHFPRHLSHCRQSWATPIQSQTSSCLKKGQCHNRHSYKVLNITSVIRNVDYGCPVLIAVDLLIWVDSLTLFLIVIVFASPCTLSPSTSSNLVKVVFTRRIENS